MMTRPGARVRARTLDGQSRPQICMRKIEQVSRFGSPGLCSHDVGLDRPLSALDRSSFERGWQVHAVQGLSRWYDANGRAGFPFVYGKAVSPAFSLTTIHHRGATVQGSHSKPVFLFGRTISAPNTSTLWIRGDATDLALPLTL